MARTPSMTTAEAEAILGSRGHLVVTPDNRPTVRKWLTAQGFSAMFVAALSKYELAAAYNGQKGMEAVQKKYADAKAAMADQDGQDGQGDLIDVPEAPPAPVPPHRQNEPAGFPVAPQGDAAQMLRDLILGGWTPPATLDEDRVRQIVGEQLAGIGPHIIEIRHPDKEPIKLEGLTHVEFPRCLKYLTTDGPNGYKMNLMVVGPVGCGKTHLFQQLAKAMGRDHTIVPCTAGTTEGDLIGRLLPPNDWAYVPSEFIKLYERGNALICFDEMDKLDPNMSAIANMPTSNGHAYVHLRYDNPKVIRGKDVSFVATANTFGTGSNPQFVGSIAQDEATRDRWLYISVDYDKRLEESIGAAGGLTAAEMASIWEMRDKIRESGKRRAIGTRAFQKASIMKACGDSWREVRARLTEGWSKDEKAVVGI